MKKRNLLMALVAIFALVFTGCGGNQTGESADTTDAVEEDIVIRAATMTDYPPYCYLDEDDNLTGFDTELMQAISDRLDGYTIDIAKGDWDSIFMDIDSNQLDLSAVEVAITEERQEKYLFSEPYLEIQSVIVTQKGRTDIQSIDDLVGKNVVSTLDSYGEILQQYNDEHEEQINITWLSSYVAVAEVFSQLSQGIYDAYLNDPVLANDLIEENGFNLEVVGAPVRTEYAGIVFQKNEQGEKLKALIDPIIQEMKEDGSLAELSIKWTGADYSPE